MGTFGSYFRLALGILISLEVIRIYAFGGEESFFAMALALAFLASTVIFFLRRMSLE